MTARELIVELMKGELDRPVFINRNENIFSIVYVDNDMNDRVDLHCQWIESQKERT